MKSFSIEELEDLHWYRNYFYGYENKYEDEGVTRTNEEKWASKQFAEDEKLKRKIWAFIGKKIELTPAEEADAVKAQKIVKGAKLKFEEMVVELYSEDVIKMAMDLTGFKITNVVTDD